LRLARAILDRFSEEVNPQKAGKTLYTTKSMVSYDGKTITQTTKGVNGDGLPITIKTVWDKQ